MFRPEPVFKYPENFNHQFRDARCLLTISAWQEVFAKMDILKQRLCGNRYLLIVPYFHVFQHLRLF